MSADVLFAKHISYQRTYLLISGHTITPVKKWQDAAFFEEKGFETVYSPFINEESIESMVSLCADRGNHGMVQTTWHRPHTAVPYVILTGALQWCGKRPDENVREDFAKKWYN